MLNTISSLKIKINLIPPHEIKNEFTIKHVTFNYLTPLYEMLFIRIFLETHFLKMHW